MKEIVRYILETVVCSGILYGAYLLFLRNCTGYLAARLCLKMCIRDRLELFPMVAKTFLTDQKKKAYEATAAKDTPKTAARSEHKVEAKAITGHKVTAPLPGKIIALKVKVGDKVKAGQEVVILEAMKMENSITSDVAGTIKQILVQEGDNVATDAILVEVEE